MPELFRQSDLRVLNDFGDIVNEFRSVRTVQLDIQQIQCHTVSVFGGIRKPIVDEMREKMYELLPESVLHDRADGGYGKNP